MGVDRFHIPLAIVLVLLVWESLLGTRRRRYKPQAAASMLATWILILGAGNLKSADGGNAANGVASEPNARSSPRELYNEGTRQLRERKLREAEGLLQTAVTSNDEKLQPPALYNLGYVRFRSGQEALKEASDSGATKARHARATSQTDTAIQIADRALAGDDVAAIVQAYRLGPGHKERTQQSHGSSSTSHGRIRGHFAALAARLRRLQKRVGIETGLFEREIECQNYRPPHRCTSG